LRKFVFIHSPWILLMIAISIQSSFKGIPLPDLGISFTDKILHFTVFGILGWFLARGMYLSRKDIFHRRFVIAACVIGFLFAFSDEWHQSMVPSRTPDFFDWVADSIGITVFALLYYWHKYTRLKAQS